MLFNFSLAVIALAPEAAEHGSLIEVNPGLIFWTIITFLILVLVLTKVAWKPIIAALNQRESAIKEAMEKAETAKEEAKKVLDENQANLAHAEEEAKKIVDQSREFAEKLKEQMLNESKQQAQKIIEDATAVIERQKDSAFDELKSHVAQIAIQATEKILREKMDAESQKKIVNEYISEITKN